MFDAELELVLDDQVEVLIQRNIVEKKCEPACYIYFIFLLGNGMENFI